MWNYHNEAVDHYSSMVLIAHYVKPELNQPDGSLYQTMIRCRELCMLENGLLTLYDLKNVTKGNPASPDRLSEWLRDGLIHIAEIMGTETMWLTDTMLIEAERRGGITVYLTKPEFVGHMLQSVFCLYAMLGKEKCLLAAESLADAQLAQPHVVLNQVAFFAPLFFSVLVG